MSDDVELYNLKRRLEQARHNLMVMTAYASARGQSNTDDRIPLCFAYIERTEREINRREHPTCPTPSEGGSPAPRATASKPARSRRWFSPR